MFVCAGPEGVPCSFKVADAGAVVVAVGVVAVVVLLVEEAVDVGTAAPVTKERVVVVVVVGSGGGGAVVEPDALDDGPLPLDVADDVWSGVVEAVGGVLERGEAAATGGGRG